MTVQQQDGATTVRQPKEGDPAARPMKRQRKKRPSYSCQECRRLKMKCDRREPCSNCVRRHRSDQCHGASTKSDSRVPHPREADQPQSSRLPAISRLEQTQQHVLDQQPLQSQDLTPRLEHGSVGRSIADDRPSFQQQFQPPHFDSAQERADAPQRIEVQETQYNDYAPEGLSRLDQLAQIARLIEPASVLAGQTRDCRRLPPAEVSRQPSVLVNSISRPNEPSSQPFGSGELVGSYGTLMCTDGGRSKYLGPTAGSEWLKDSETREASASPIASRAPSPDTRPVSNTSHSHRGEKGAAPIAFPFSGSSARIRTRDLLSSLPPRQEAWTLAESYFRYCAWHHDVAPKAPFEKTFDRVYKCRDRETMHPPLNPQEIALVYMIMAQGTLYNIEMAYNDASAEAWLHLAQRALVKGDFLATNMVPGLQTLHLMAHHHLESDKSRQGDNAWPLWGLVMRLIQAMGMHRDGTRWGLPEDVVEERRRVFWECNSADIFQAHCFSRPSAINPEHCDTAFPTEVLQEEQSYSRLRYKLSLLSSEILNMAMRVRRPSYSAVTDLDLSLCNLERSIPFFLRCRAALLSMPSRYLNREEAIQASPEPSKTSMVVSFQQMNLTINFSETIINLHRPYFAKTIYEDLDDPVKSEFAPSYLAVIERCSIIIAVVSDIHARFPAVSIRQWNLWYHVFNSALCLATLVLRDPRNTLASMISAQLDASVYLFTSLIQHGANTLRYRRNLQSLLQLRHLATSKVNLALKDPHQHPGAQAYEERTSHDGDDNEDLELIGWRTRLVERAGQASRIVRTISNTASPNSVTETVSAPPAEQSQMRDAPDSIRLPDPTASQMTPDSILTSDVLHNYWDPLLPNDLFPDAYEGLNVLGSHGWAEPSQRQANDFI